MFRHVAALFVFAASACATVPTPSHPTVAVGDRVPLCAHRVPAASCVRCTPTLVEGFKRQGDWCEPHDIPESQCLECHPGMQFAALPPLPESADYRLVSPMGEDLPELSAHVAPGKVTVFDFFAAWCVTCRDLDIDLALRLQGGAPFALRKANVMDWASPLARRYLASVPSLPYVIVFDREGKRVGEMSGYRPDELERLLTKAAR